MMVGEVTVIASESFKEPYSKKLLVRKFPGVLADSHRSKSVSTERPEVFQIKVPLLWKCPRQSEIVNNNILNNDD
ncbi:hypothetical protein BpHYR1_046464 [Brachionus plicatilis]|uniref:Uncharacterized protein n=1 Tax=Brachionus plicatilis TaxID=10195 RepID=A0A3M7Q8Y2_BRAPC|nr:hypothetical protein BpHYR1_046464 [Brachionus plicatilis]